MNSIKVFVCIAPGGTILPWSVGDGEEWVKGKMCDYEFEQPTGPGRRPLPGHPGLRLQTLRIAARKLP